MITRTQRYNGSMQFDYRRWNLLFSIYIFCLSFSSRQIADMFVKYQQMVIKSPCGQWKDQLIIRSAFLALEATEALLFISSLKTRNSIPSCRFFSTPRKNWHIPPQIEVYRPYPTTKPSAQGKRRMIPHQHLVHTTASSTRRRTKEYMLGCISMSIGV